MSHIEQNQTDRVPTGPRDTLQFVLMEKMGIKRGDHKAQNEWASKYASLIAIVIDNKENQQIREFINEGKFDEAAEILLETIEAKESQEQYH
jgi:hypothetical protein